jgi:small subunit ribosomal protein S17
MAMETKRKSMVGSVVSTKMEKTAIVAVESLKHHRLYHKTFRRVTNYKVHDEEKRCKPGDKVRIVETRPMSKEKRWRVAEIIVKGNVADIKPGEIK